MMIPVSSGVRIFAFQLFFFLHRRKTTGPGFATSRAALHDDDAFLIAKQEQHQQQLLQQQKNKRNATCDMMTVALHKFFCQGFLDNANLARVEPPRSKAATWTTTRARSTTQETTASE